MTTSQRTKDSTYMEWAKLCSTARFNLATSGILNVPRAEFAFADAELEITGPGGYGYAPLQERIAAHAGVTPECVVAAAGTSMANHLALAAVLDPGDEVLIEEPAYGPLLDVADYLGARVKRFRRSFAAGFVLEMAEIEAAITDRTRLIVVTNMHNPSGALIAAETMRALGELALTRGLHVLVDEVYLEMLPDRHALGSFKIGATLGGGENNPFIVTSSLTKAFGLSGLRCGWIIAAPPLARRISRMNDLFGANAAHAAEQLSVIAFDQLPRFQQRAEALLARNRPLLDGFLDSRDDLECFRPVAGTVVFPKLRQGNARRFVQLLREEFEASVVPGEFFEMPEHFRIGIGGDTDDLRASLSRLSAALDQFSG